ncbi:MAG: hypothetical protein M3N16_04045, partial [Actinomycetota bacterium]|nr:hypothetical protein [Actinomycetota bacterium]
AVTGAARRVPGAERVESGATEALGGEDEFPIPGYDALRASDVLARLPELTQDQLGRVEAYERAGKARKTVLAKIDSLRGDEPWPGYDDQEAEEIERRLSGADPETAARVRDYERRHRARETVMAASGRLAPASG